MVPENRTAKRKHSVEETYSIWSRAFRDSSCRSSHLVLYPAGFISVVYSISFCCCGCAAGATCCCCCGCGCGCGCGCWKLNWNGEGEEDGACVVAGAGVWKGFGAAGVWNGFDADGVWNGFDAAGKAKENAIAAAEGSAPATAARRSGKRTGGRGRGGVPGLWLGRAGSASS